MIDMRGVTAAVAAAVLFGLSAPLAKPLLRETGPLMLAALLYLGGGLGLAFVSLLTGRSAAGENAPREAPLRGADFLLVVSVVAVGGIAAPVLLLVGLARLSAVAGSLLLNLEAPLTMLLAVGVFGEHLGPRAAAGAGLTVLGALVLSLAPGDARSDWLGVGAVALACLGWAIDNNLTQRLSLRDPMAIARTKGLGAGMFTLVLALASGAPFPPVGTVFAAMVLGFASYGISVVLAIRAMRSLGAARHAVIFSSAPFIGALAAVPILGERFGFRETAASGLMLLGVASLLAEVHQHWHDHELLEHEHAHVHDAHHRHGHGDPEPELERVPHAHPHTHLPLSHAHPHVSDIHHRHGHRREPTTP
jgi:drug/metabolite transporter (DMT)-like permease